MMFQWLLGALALLLIAIGFAAVIFGIKRIDYYRCEQIIKRNSATFYRAFSTVQDKARRRGIFAVYAFCRQVDDAIDERQDPAMLERFNRQLIALKDRGQASSFMWRALKDTLGRYFPRNYDFKPFFDMLEGQRFDTKPVAIQKMEELIHYCDLVASSVGFMLLPILAPNRKPELDAFATDLGRAFQLTNILRDIGEDYRRNRIYLPLELMQRFRIRLSDIESNQVTSHLIEGWEFLAHLAEDYYQKALMNIRAFPRDVQFALTAALFFYRGILKACRDAQYDVLSKRNFVSDAEKVNLLQQVKAFLKGV